MLGRGGRDSGGLYRTSGKALRASEAQIGVRGRSEPPERRLQPGLAAPLAVEAGSGLFQAGDAEECELDFIG